MAQETINPDTDLSDFEGDFEDTIAETDEESAEGAEVDLSAQGFPEITKRFEPVPHKYYSDAEYYKTVLSEEGEHAKRLHVIFQKYIGAKDPKDRSVYRTQIISIFWEFLRNVAKKTPGKLIPQKKFLLRFNILHHNFINSEAKEFFGKLVTENELNQPIYYVDEWLKGVGTGVIRPSTTDEVKIAHNNTQLKMRHLLDKAQGKLDGARALLKAKVQERIVLEDSLQEHLNTISERVFMEGFDDVYANYTEAQKRTINEMQEVLKSLLGKDREHNSSIRDYRQAEADVQTLQGKVESGGEDTVIDLQAVDSEFDTIRQASKMTVGRQGNHFPVLTSEYFHNGPNDVGFRENLISMLTRIESIDTEVFCRYYRNRMNRIVPYVLLLPTYGDTGICREPFDKHNRATSRGRIMLPMYPKNLYIAVLSALADLRWQVTKEKASYYWMEEGLTGNYYQ
jgi:ferritin